MNNCQLMEFPFSRLPSRLQSWLSLHSQCGLVLALQLVATTQISVVAQRRWNHPRRLSLRESRAESQAWAMELVHEALLFRRSGAAVLAPTRMQGEEATS